MPERIPLKDPRFKGKRYEPRYEKGAPELNPQESPEMCAEKIATLEALMTDFESTHNLDELRAIRGFTSAEERDNSPRTAARDALAPIDKQLKYLSAQEAVPTETYANLHARYRTLSRAVGMVRDDPTGSMFEIVAHDI